MHIEIDKNSGFCFGVVNAIKKAENTLRTQETLYCLGDIVHNNAEVERLAKLGLVTIDHKTYFTLRDCSVLLRAHGEPPQTYTYAQENNITLIDATCPVVLKLQERISKASKLAEPDTQFLIYGKKGHAEVNGLVGQTQERAIVIENLDDLGKVDFSKPIQLFSQTTKGLEGFHEIVNIIRAKSSSAVAPKTNDTICRQVANRIPKIKTFAKKFACIIFVSGKKSSNGKMLYEISKAENPNSFMVSSPEELDKAWFKNKESVGICGATSTPMHLMESVAKAIKQLTETT